MDNRSITPEMARAELAKRELARRGVPLNLNEESLGASLGYAIPRIGIDIANNAYNAIQKIPDYIRKAQTEVPGLVNAVKEDPLGLMAQGYAGTAEMGKTIFNYPHDILNYAANRLNLFPKDWNTKVQMARMPEDTEQMINKTFGEPNRPGEELFRGINRNMIGLISIGGALSALKPTTLKSIKNTILDTHDALENRASQGFDTVSNEVNKRGITQIPINPSEIDQLREYFPKTKKANKLIQNASTGDYNALRDIQSDLYKKATDAKQSPLMMDKNIGDEIFEKRDNINQAISDHLLSTGNTDLNDLLNQSRNDYRTLQNIYYNKDMNNAIIKMVNKDTRKSPNNLIKVLQEQSIPMQNLKDYHPGLESSINSYMRRQNVSKLAKKATIPLGIGALGGAGGYFVSKHD